MVSSRGAINRTSAARYDIDGLLAAIDGVPTVTDPVAVRRRSRDFFWYSPILNQQLAAKSADIPSDVNAADVSGAPEGSCV